MRRHRETKRWETIGEGQDFVLERKEQLALSKTSTDIRKKRLKEQAVIHAEPRWRHLSVRC